jgi:EmrB/QacA subfamily drug resistance transporter
VFLPATESRRRALTFFVAATSAFIVVLDGSVLAVSLPTIIRDLDTTLPAVQWVISGYSLTFSALLIIGGRLVDVFGRRRVFAAGFALFTAGSLLAALSTSVVQLVLGEAVIEGMGASLLLPASVSLLSNTFHGRARAKAFAAWGATTGLAGALGPVIGGLLTSHYSWRWCFGINVIVAPLALVIALVSIPRETPSERRLGIDASGAALVATGVFLLVFAISQGSHLGWWSPREPLSLAGQELWGTDGPLSVIPLVVVVAVATLLLFVVVERGKEAACRDALFDFGLLRFRSYRYGLATAFLMSVSMYGFIYTLPLFLQDAKGLSPATNGLWMLPYGCSLFAFAQVGGLLVERLGSGRVVQLGLACITLSLLLLVAVIDVDLTFVELLPALLLLGCGIGFASAQLTNVILAEVPPAGMGVASGTSSTVRQVSGAVGISVVYALLTTQTARAAVTQSATEAVATGTRAALTLGMALSGLCFLVALLLPARPEAPQ